MEVYKRDVNGSQANLVGYVNLDIDSFINDPKKCNEALDLPIKTNFDLKAKMNLQVSTNSAQIFEALSGK